MTEDEILLTVEEKMEKAISVLKENLAGIRTGRANPGLVESIKVEAYGTSVPLKQLAAVGAPEPQQLVIRPYDPGTLKDIEKAIRAADLGFNPQNDGRVIRVNVPPLSMEVRKKMVARIRELCEEAKIAIRNIRREGNKLADQAEKDKLLSEDDCERLKERIQELTKEYEEKANELAKNREKDVLEG
ncbi:Ribosome recycling factor [Thermogutta terrifontis]|jgi:ribosome recycling factor|uniref:Ribosome-recycling factor n=2 Tax=Thermogutta TaxID=1676125 RepID=A0A286R9V3_9BACT|nr:ribosome recycling factor [Thermogutta terrifontis]ASV72730.1 Ribosome recycling factor [Thermogutta terrifontis]